MIKACSNRNVTLQVGGSLRDLEQRKKEQMSRVKKENNNDGPSQYHDLEIVLSKTFDEDEVPQ
jgi:hypothetical protein